MANFLYLLQVKAARRHSGEYRNYRQEVISMSGAITGGIVGSRFEFHNHKSKGFQYFGNDGLRKLCERMLRVFGS